MNYLLIALGSALGGMARHAVGAWSLSLWGPAFPWGTLIVNILGSFIIGVVAMANGLGEQAKLFLAVGLCGGFTTFSAFSVQTLNLIEAGAWGYVALNVAGSVALCLLAVGFGAWVAR